ncbi:MAG: helix-turn-helix transcriptional regulator [Rhodospirillales bacterium]|nr:helix-turn-helix transcriptional regulator [Rhodospirillales bacterium]
MTVDTIGRLMNDLRGDSECEEAFAIVEVVRATGDMLERMRERAGLSQTQLAEKLGLTPGRVWQLESGTMRNAPSLKTMVRWARACGETVAITASGECGNRDVSSPSNLQPEKVRHGDHYGGLADTLMAALPTVWDSVFSGRHEKKVKQDVVPVPGYGGLDERDVSVVVSAAAKALKERHLTVTARKPQKVGAGVEALTLVVSEV